MPIDPKDRPLIDAKDEVFQVLITVVKALKAQPGFDVPAFESIIRERLDKKDLGKQGFAALMSMLDAPWEG